LFESELLHDTEWGANLILKGLVICACRWVSTITVEWMGKAGWTHQKIRTVPCERQYEDSQKLANSAVLQLPFSALLIHPEFLKRETELLLTVKQG